MSRRWNPKLGKLGVTWSQFTRVRVRVRVRPSN
jgi:hypothetical protein